MLIPVSITLSLLTVTGLQWGSQPTLFLSRAAPADEVVAGRDRILLDGVDLREYDIESLRRNVGVLFQDFVRYDFVLRENIAVGNVGRLGDEPAIKAAAERSLADSVAQRLAGGTTRCWASDSTAGWTCRAASGRRWRWPGRTCGMLSC
ncbi:MAG TPA: hypothetical protein VFS51_01510 [Gemmatimonadales bacterium]|nr:hypothetical protein [Gemmatimonadales bacterium]